MIWEGDYLLDIITKTIYYFKRFYKLKFDILLPPDHGEGLVRTEHRCTRLIGDGLLAGIHFVRILLTFQRVGSLENLVIF